MPCDDTPNRDPRPHQHKWHLGQWGGDTDGLWAVARCGRALPVSYDKGCGATRRVRISAAELASKATNP